MIPLGYELETGKPVSVPLGHLVVTGQTQKSGKTTTLEALITRSELRAVAFITKRGEKSFRLMHPIPPYFQERADWQFVQALLETAMKQKQDFKQAWIMRASDGASTLADVRGNIRRYLHGERDPKAKKSAEKWLLRPARGLNADMYYVLDQYFEEVMPQLARLRSSRKLELAVGVNVMDLSPYSFPMQALVIRSVLECVYQTMRGVIVIIPEAWEFIPEGQRSPVRLAAEELIRKGAAERNYVWLDSQDIAGVAKVLLRQMEVWIFGVQRDPRELKRTLDAIPDLPRPKPAEVQLLGKGQFIVAYGNRIQKVYVQPAGMEDAHAQAIALDQESPDSWRQIVRALDEQEEEAALGDACGEAGAEGLAMELGTKSAGADGENSPPEAERVGISDAADSGALSGAQFHPSISTIQESDSPTPESGEFHAGIDQEEAMWKEKYEALEAEHKELIQAHDSLVSSNARLCDEVAALNRELKFLGKNSSPFPTSEDDGAGSPTGPSAPRTDASLDAIYAFVKSRAAKDPGVLELLRVQPELRVKAERRVLKMNDAETDGRIALLIHSGFFSAPRSTEAVNKEFKRRGWFSIKTSNAALLKPIARIAEMGFLVRKAEGYQAVPGMKVSTE
jgi:hypothetical protein